MADREELLAKIQNNPKDVRFTELCKLLELDGWTQKSTQTSSSHYVYKKPGFGRVTIVKHGSKVLEAYVKNALKAMGV